MSEAPCSTIADIPRIVAVAGGKGGVGKSVIATNLACVLAGRGYRCTLVDLDLGGANLHTLLGMKSPQRSLSDLLRRRAASLPEVAVDTPFANLQLISGTRALLEMANPKHAQKVKILRQLLRLETDVVLIDLGAGSHFNVLDFFLAAHEPLMVLAPNPLSVENGYHFLKALYFRKFKGVLRQLPCSEPLERELRTRVAQGLRSPRHLLEVLAQLDPQACRQVKAKMRALAPQLLLNQVVERRDAEIGPQMADACRRYFGLAVDFWGAVPYDERIHRALRNRQPASRLYPESPFALSLHGMAERIFVTKELK